MYIYLFLNTAFISKNLIYFETQNQIRRGCTDISIIYFSGDARKSLVRSGKLHQCQRDIYEISAVLGHSGNVS